MKNSLVTTQKQIVNCKNKAIADDFVRRYQKHTQDALENILSMGEAVFEIYQKVKANELVRSDLEYFCQTVHLDSQSSTFRKYKAIGEKASRFREILEKLPPTFSVLYEMATLSGDDFELFTKNMTLSKNTTLEEFKQMLRRAHSKCPAIVGMPSNRIMKIAAQEVQKYTNHFDFTALTSIKKSQLDEIINTLNTYREKGWIRYKEAKIFTFYIDDDIEVNFEMLPERGLTEKIV